MDESATRCFLCLDSEQHEQCAERMCTRRGTLRCGACKAVWYCSDACQKAHWKADHKRLCVSVQHDSAGTRSPQPTRTSSGPIQMGCGCRGDGGLAHVACMIKLAVSQPKTRKGEAWFTCQTCKLRFTGEMQLALARAWAERTTGRMMDDATVAALSNLGSALTSAAKYDESIGMLLTLQATLDRKDPRWISIMCNIGNNILGKGEYADAEAHFRQLLNHVGADESYQYTHMIQSNLAASLMYQNKNAEAGEMLKHVLDVVKRTRGAEHTDTLSVVGTLAQCLFLQDGKDKKEQAERLQRELLLLNTRVHGREHPETLNTLSSLSCTLFELGKFEESARLAEEAHEKTWRVLGKEHPRALDRMANLAKVLIQIGQQERAVHVMRTCLDLRRRLLGPEHNDTVETSMALDMILADVHTIRNDSETA